MNLVYCSHYSTIKALLDSRKESQKEFLGVVETITYTCFELQAQVQSTEPSPIFVEGFVHGHEKIGECSLKQWLSVNHIPELKAIEFEAVFPGRKQLDRRYRNHPAIKKMLDETLLKPSVDGKRLRFDFYGSSAEPERTLHVRANTWFLQARVRFLGDRNFRTCSRIERIVKRHPSRLHR